VKKGIQNSQKIIGTLFLVSLITLNFSLPQTIECNEPFFTIVIPGVYKGIQYYANLLNDLSVIGINGDIIVCDCGGDLWYYTYFFQGEFDMIYYVVSSSPNKAVDFRQLYCENGSLNIPGYHTSLDYNESLKTGLNEWYLQEGVQITPIDSEEIITHYWQWQEYLMDDILPCVPMLAPPYHHICWSNLKGYNTSLGLLQSWGMLKWEGSHIGQESVEEVVIADFQWLDLNPITQNDDASRFVSNAILDPLLWIDAKDGSVWPHLAQSFQMINETHLRIITRDGVKWQKDPEELFTNEYFDIKDVYFTLFCEKLDWIKDMKIIDKNTLDIFIDSNPNTIENEPYNQILNCLSLNILPEHYLNQSQLEDGVTPDKSHPSWATYKTKCFGTGLFKLISNTRYEKTQLQISPNNWWLNSTLTSDPDLEWERRFGDFSSGINQLRIIHKNLDSKIILFEYGKVDLLTDLIIDNSHNSSWLDPKYFLDNTPQFLSWEGFAFNLRTKNDKIINNQQLCEEDPTITKGLAVRKAIAYAINKAEINSISFGGKYRVISHPIPISYTSYCKPDIITYDYNLEQAKYYMKLAGYDYDERVTNSIGLNFISKSIIMIVTLTTLVISYKNLKFISREIGMKKKCN